MKATHLPKKGYWVYVIVSPNGKVYVGKTKRMYDRCYQYHRGFREGRTDHINRYMLNAMQKYGIDSFSMIPWEHCRDAEHVAEREIYWMDALLSCDPDRGYNLRRDTQTGMETHPLTSAHISNNLKRQWASGIRDGHAEKLRRSWNNRDREAQGRLFSRLKTRWRYFVTFNGERVEFNYHGLRALKLWSGAVTAFNRHRTNKATVKGFLIEREICNG